jgi:phosphomannomutase/phosphoglucomutase
VTPEIRVDCPDPVKFELVQRVQTWFVEQAKARRPVGQAGPIRDVVTIDGIRVIFNDGWGLVRASNTQPALVLRFEATSPERLAAIRQVVEAKLGETQRAMAQ